MNESEHKNELMNKNMKENEKLKWTWIKKWINEHRKWMNEQILEMNEKLNMNEN